MANPNSYVDTLDNVNMHLKTMCNALASDDCQFDILMTKKGQSATDPYSTAYTLQTLEFDSKDCDSHKEYMLFMRAWKHTYLLLN